LESIFLFLNSYIMENIPSIFNFIMKTPFAFGSFLLSLRSTMAFEPLPLPLASLCPLPFPRGLYYKGIPFEGINT
jgi:hypothetical protein